MLSFAQINTLSLLPPCTTKNLQRKIKFLDPQKSEDPKQIECLST